VGNPTLRATLVLMCWSLEAGSGRTWTDYYPGPTVIDVLSWDCYNREWQDGRYVTPAKRFEEVIAVSRSTGKPFGIAELGTVFAVGDTTGAGRAQWLRDSAVYLAANNAAFVTYFDSTVGADYRLLDRPSQQAWRWAVSG